MAVPPTMRRGNPEMETPQSVTSHHALNMVQTLQNNFVYNEKFEHVC